MAIPTLIYCAAGNKRYARIAIDAGYKYGARLPASVSYPPYFVDQDWRKPDRSRYMDALARWHPYLATVLDLEHIEQIPEIIGWAEEATRFVNEIIIIPKKQGSVASLPKSINGKRVRLGYSVPSTYGGTTLPFSDFIGWPVHLLGGSPHRQIRLSSFLNVVSADGNMMMKMANSCRFWRNQKSEKGHWVNLYEVGDRDWGQDANYEAFRRSCINIMEAWEKICSTPFCT